MTTLNEGWNKPGDLKRYHFFSADGTPACGLFRGTAQGPLLAEPESEGACRSCLMQLFKDGRLNYSVQSEREAEPIWLADAPGFTFFSGHGATRLEMECQHQHGMVYITEGADMNWVCSRLRRPAHSLAGFFRELGELDDNRVKNLMQRWGLYYRELPLAEQPEETEEEAAATVIPLTPT